MNDTDQGSSMHRLCATPLGVLALAGVFSGLGLILFGPALQGGFVADDVGYVLNNPYVQTADWRHLLAALDPLGDAAYYVANYAPVHQLVTMVEWQLFGDETWGYHLVNVLLHGICSALLVAWFFRTGLSGPAACALGFVFFAHTANVETVAWIFQTKTLLCLALGTGSLLAFERRPLLATALFALALLAKIAALLAWPVLAAWLWVRGPDALSRGRVWILAWAVVAILCAIPEFLIFADTGHAALLDRYSGPFEQGRSMLGLAARYLVMAATTLGVAFSHEPPVAGLADPWWWAGLLACLALAWRMTTTLARREIEGVHWLWAAAAYAPASQVFTFLFPMGDRYLYTVLPGLLAGSALALHGATGSLRFGRIRPWLGPLLAAGLALLFASHSYQRAPLWRNEMLLMVDSARKYPDGRSAAFLGARSLTREGDLDGAYERLEKLANRGFDAYQILQDPVLQPLRGHPGYEALHRRLVQNWLDHGEGRRAGQSDWMARAAAYLAIGDLASAENALGAAIEVGGPWQESAEAQLRQVQAARSKGS
ncbi:MAG: hypothetical protein CL910_22320 [Deltaproteobacteria bacterium]|jgi:hypothetical protein|nr:hypothetical protein [Deltaproteobacteria bacterium]